MTPALIEHWGITRSAFTKLRMRDSTFLSTDHRQIPGRPRVFSPSKKKKSLGVYNTHRGLLNALSWSRGLEAGTRLTSPMTGYETIYNGKKRRSPERATATTTGSRGGIRPLRTEEEKAGLDEAEHYHLRTLELERMLAYIQRKHAKQIKVKDREILEQRERAQKSKEAEDTARIELQRTVVKLEANHKSAIASLKTENERLKLMMSSGGGPTTAGGGRYARGAPGVFIPVDEDQGQGGRQPDGA